MSYGVFEVAVVVDIAVEVVHSRQVNRARSSSLGVFIFLSFEASISLSKIL